TEMIFSQNLFRRPTPARLTRIEKSLLQAHFRLVNYCQYNFVEHRTLIFHAYGDSIKSNHLPTELSFCKIK
ncbi:hypothetical protein, partial [Staphylococcus aureus]|uniref:hypothetical protein n=1 Tax=Staphylococcus aureus TaxID=1280 RepID=UPI001BFDC317